MHRPLLFFTVFCFLSASLQAQSGYLPLHRELELWHMSASMPAKNFHPAIHPYRLSDFQPDSNKLKRKIQVHPLLHLSGGVGNDSYLRTGAGTSLVWDPFNKLNLTIRYHIDYLDAPAAAERLTENGFIPHYARSLQDYGNNQFLFHDLTGSLSWTPLPSLNMQLGRDRNFWGEGYRSLFLSDNSAAYPFVKTTLSAWHIRYVSLLTAMRDVDLPGNTDELHPKYTALHYLSWNVTRRINLALFETVIWRGDDNSMFRGFDFQYVNPAVFYRPVEFSIGSPDNVLLGLAGSAQIFQKTRLYGQFLLDEFVLDKMLHQKDWWANKYGIQLGLRSQDAFGISRLYLLAEVNTVRPYTYSHSSTLRSFGYMYQPLAHPLGANFAEGILNLQYLRSKKLLSLTGILQCQGTDNSAASYGGDIYKIYDLRPSDLGHKTLQGVRSDRMILDLHYTRMLSADHSLALEVGSTALAPLGNNSDPFRYYFYLSLKTLLNNDEYLRY